MTTNELMTLSISLLALVVSVASAIVAYGQQDKSLRTTIRDQLTSMVQDLIAAQGDMTMLNAEPVEKRDASYPARSSSANIKLTSLARQTCALSDMQPNVAFDVELIAIATALALMGDLPLAESYFKRAIEKSPSAYYKVVNLGMYANFLFQQSRYAEGRGIYRDSLTLLDNSTDFNKWANGFTYQSWFADEVWNGPGPSDEASKYYDNARSLYQSISVAGRRESSLSELERAAAPSTVDEAPTRDGDRRPMPGRSDGRL